MPGRSRQGFKTSKHHPNYDPAKEKIAPKLHTARSLRQSAISSKPSELAPANTTNQSKQQTPQVNTLLTVPQTPASSSASPKIKIKLDPITIPRTDSGLIIAPQRSTSDPIITPEIGKSKSKAKIETKADASKDEETTVCLRSVFACVACCSILGYMARIATGTVIAISAMNFGFMYIAKQYINICSSRNLTSTSLNSQNPPCYQYGDVSNIALMVSTAILVVGFLYCNRRNDREQEQGL